MKLLLNSDITFSQGLRANLPQHLAALADACKERKFEIALPLTSALEFERQQVAIATQEQAALLSAAATLERYRIPHGAFNAHELIKVRSLADLFQERGVSVDVIEPTIDDFNDAHRRASLHLSPQIPNDKGEDEMRDLLIWAIAIRVANAGGGALLVSRDKIHTGDLGKSEAQAARLSIVSSVEDALKFLKIETPDAKLFIEMLTPVWTDLPGLGLAVADAVSVSEVRNAQFVQGSSGRTFALATVHVRLKDGSEKAAVIQLQTHKDGSTTVHIFDVGEAAIKGSEALPSEPPSEPDPAYEARLARLRRVVRG